MEKMALRFNRVITEFLCRSEADRNEADEIDAGSGPDFTRSRRGRGDHAGAHSTRALPDFLPDLLIDEKASKRPRIEPRRRYCTVSVQQCECCRVDRSGELSVGQLGLAGGEQGWLGAVVRQARRDENLRRQAIYGRSAIALARALV
jgi:hypothetical protein